IAAGHEIENFGDVVIHIRKRDARRINGTLSGTHLQSEGSGRKAKPQPGNLPMVDFAHRYSPRQATIMPGKRSDSLPGQLSRLACISTAKPLIAPARPAAASRRAHLLSS